jgi:hypothetical protein
MQSPQELSLSLHGICLAGDDFTIMSAQGIGMSAMVIAMPGIDSLTLVEGTAQDDPTPPRKIPSATTKVAICRPMA